MTPEKPARRPRIYLAGPDVFFPHRDDVFRDLKSRCEREGLIGVAPIDAPIQHSAADGEDRLAQAIYDGNVALIRDADGCIANLQSFRGLEPDSGTVFEVGFAVALGKPVVVYGVPPGTYAERVGAVLACERDAKGALREKANGTTVEGLGQRLNLMLTRSTHLVPDAEAAIALMARLVGGRSPS
ncbi:nucleoside 2-deoxyribosyltransferase [Variovorax ureilyticus]|uniref:Nucleoside 2-deoxyribosyltransferase n=1 Tax=Variovorax ureilyticus TaxID=1836198 RepID=A0ABU8VKN7_9BURK